MRLLLLLALLLSAASLRAAGGFSHSVMMDPESRDSIQVTSFMDNLPTVGFMPVKVVIENRSTSDRTWTLRPVLSQGDSIRASWTFPVKAGTRAEFEIFVPLKIGNFHYRWGSQFIWSGPGVEVGMMQLPQTGVSSPSVSLPFVGMSDSLHAKYWGTLLSTSTKKIDLAGAALDLTQAPADWRAYIAFDQTWMTAREWQAFPKDKKQAFIEAITLRNELVLVCADENEAQEIRTAFNQKNKAADWPQGAGRIHLAQSPTESQMLDIMKLGLMNKGPQKSAALENYTLSPWLEKAVPPIATAGPLVLLFIVLFGIVAGPVNLFILAPAGRRHRLFITTPVISLAGALILAAAIFVQDGTGGSGVRLIHAQILPEQKRLLITQEQTARAGLLLGSSFKTADPVWLQPLINDDGSHYMNSNLHFAIAPDGSYTGDWFRSRTRQSHLIQAVRPSRAAIEFTPGDPPTILSTFESDLAHLYLIDPQGKAWTAQNVHPGERITLQPADKYGPRVWWNERRTTHDLRGLLHATTELNPIHNAHFHAETTDPAPFAIDTLPAIRWQTPLILISGPLTIK